MRGLLLRVIVLTIGGAYIALAMWTPRPVHASGRTRITIDAGHGGREIGAGYRFSDGVVLQEKTLNLQVALLLRDLLQQQPGYEVTLTRTTDAPVNALGLDLNGDSRVGLADELQARVDVANAAGSDLFISIHFNGSSDSMADGTETFWNSQRPFATANQALADNVQKAIVSQLAEVGYAPRDRGAHTDSSILGESDSFFVLGPRSSTIARPSGMPGIIVEPLFVTNPADATALRDSRTLAAVARGLLRGIQASVGLAPAQQHAPVAAAVRSATGQSQAGLWTVWAETYADSSTGRRLAQKAARTLTSHGLAASLVSSSQSRSLIPGFIVVTSGEFSTRQAALAHATQLHSAGYPRAYARTIAR